jgi:hypothetical protein
MKKLMAINVRIVVETLRSKKAMTKDIHAKLAIIIISKTHVNSPAKKNNGTSIKTSNTESKIGSIRFESLISLNSQKYLQSL